MQLPCSPQTTPFPYSYSPPVAFTIGSSLFSTKTSEPCEEGCLLFSTLGHLWGSVSISIYCKKKLLWYVLRKAVTYGYKPLVLYAVSIKIVGNHLLGTIERLIYLLIIIPSMTSTCRVGLIPYQEVIGYFPASNASVVMSCQSCYWWISLG